MPESGQAVLDVTPGGQVVIHTGFTEMGQGFYTAMVQCLCDITGIGRAPRTDRGRYRPPDSVRHDDSVEGHRAGRPRGEDAARKLKADLAPAFASGTWRGASTSAYTWPVRRRRSAPRRRTRAPT